MEWINDCEDSWIMSVLEVGENLKMSVLSSFEELRWDCVSVVSWTAATKRGVQIVWNFRIRHFASSLLHSRGYQVGKLKCFIKEILLVKLISFKWELICTLT